MKVSVKFLISFILVLESFVSSATSADGCVIDVAPGWNLVGSSKVKPLAEIVGTSTSKIISIWKWDKAQEKWSFFTPLLVDFGRARATEKGYSYFGMTLPGDGLWFNVETGGQINTCAEFSTPPAPV